MFLHLIQEAAIYKQYARKLGQAPLICSNSPAIIIQTNSMYIFMYQILLLFQQETDIFESYQVTLIEKELLGKKYNKSICQSSCHSFCITFRFCVGVKQLLDHIYSTAYWVSILHYCGLIHSPCTSFLMVQSASSNVEHLAKLLLTKDN